MLILCRKWSLSETVSIHIQRTQQRNKHELAGVPSRGTCQKWGYTKKLGKIKYEKNRTDIFIWFHRWAFKKNLSNKNESAFAMHKRMDIDWQVYYAKQINWALIDCDRMQTITGRTIARFVVCYLYDYIYIFFSLLLFTCLLTFTMQLLLTHWFGKNIALS